MYGKPLLLFDNMLTEGVVTSPMGTAAGDYDLANLSDYRSYTWWLPAVVGAYRFDIDNGANRSADYIYIAGEGFNNATIQLISYDAGLVNPTGHVNTTLNGETEFFATFTSHSQQIWLLNVITTAANALSHVIIGDKLELPRHLQQGFDPLGSRPRGRLAKSSGGHPLGTAESWREWKQKIAFRNIDAAWLRDTWQPAFDGHLKHTPGVFVWDPVEHADELYLIHPIFQYAAPHVQGQFANLAFTLEGLAP